MRSPNARSSTRGCPAARACTHAPRQCTGGTWQKRESRTDAPRLLLQRLGSCSRLSTRQQLFQPFLLPSFLFASRHALKPGFMLKLLALHFNFPSLLELRLFCCLELSIPANRTHNCCCTLSEPTRPGRHLLSGIPRQLYTFAASAASATGSWTAVPALQVPPDPGKFPSEIPTFLHAIARLRLAEQVNRLLWPQSLLICRRRTSGSGSRRVGIARENRQTQLAEFGKRGMILPPKVEQWNAGSLALWISSSINIIADTAWSRPGIGCHSLCRLHTLLLLITNQEALPEGLPRGLCTLTHWLAFVVHWPMRMEAAQPAAVPS